MKKTTICLFGTYDYKYSRNSSIRDGLKEIGVKVMEVHYDIPLTRLEVKDDFTLAKSVKRVITKFISWIFLLSSWRQVRKSDAVVVLHPGHLDLPPAWLLCKIFSKPLIFDTSISPYDMYIVGRDLAKVGSVKEKVLKLVERLLLKLPDKSFTDTALMKNFIVNTFQIKPERIFTVPLGANNRLYKPTNEKRNGKVKVLFFGMYNPVHGAWHIIRAINTLKNQPIEFVMLGDGPIKEELLNYASKNKIKNLEFKGFVPEPELVKEINSADILLGTFSDVHIMKRVIPNKIFGSIACKKCVLTAEQPILEEYFTHNESIYFTKPEDSKTLAKAIKVLAKNEKRRILIGNNAYRIYLQYFTPKRVGEAVLNGIFPVEK